ncbi:hypothetical protein [Methanococcus maripaludis]|uniref:Uncharacterized protein n=1 Tax=Methanococcus maripaludis TaxID=39152 RepID=A0A2L1C9A2_METMI|nr:hypothetical protein [Methanococcus maripaludis]AVB75935.1 hypothetical protein MMJJ_05180 [Methanococcus maripaludis]MBB6497854.1 hypothetical protein [Methanococcus maripaludis]
MAKNNIWIGLAIAVILVAAGTWYYLSQDDAGGIIVPTGTTFSSDAVFNSETGDVLITFNASKENITADSIELYVSYDEVTFTKTNTFEDVAFPIDVEVTPEEGEENLYYYAVVSYSDKTYRLPTDAGSYETVEIIVSNTTEENTDLLTFTAVSDFDNTTGIVLFSLSASEDNKTADVLLFTSYDNTTFTNTVNSTALDLPGTFEFTADAAETDLYYYLEIVCDGNTSRLPAESAEWINITIAG